MFFFAGTISRVLGRTGGKIISKIAMLLLAAIAVMMVRKGIEASSRPVSPADCQEGFMEPIATIVAATDFSAAAKHAVQRAALIARQHDAELHLLHVTAPLDLYPGQELGPAVGNVRDATIHDQFGAVARWLREHYGVRVHVAQRIGRAHTQIADYAATVGADLVVIGARGESSMLRLLVGSTASRLLRVRQGPVLIVRSEPVAPYAQVLAALDLFPHARAVVEWAAELAWEGQLRLLHVLEPMDERGLRAMGLDDAASRQRQDEMRAIAGNLMADLRSGLQGEVEIRIETGYPPARILACASDWHPGLIVVGRQGRGGLEEFLLGSVSKDVVQAAYCDVLLVAEVPLAG
ncbi:MAG: universal stress protein [Sulfuritalea sp.]|nr:universal stress protein [Sulfuritalea sp.]